MLAEHAEADVAAGAEDQCARRQAVAAEAHDRLRVDNGTTRALLPAAWAASGLPFRRDGERLRPHLSFDQCRILIQAWLERVRAGKPLNLARLAKAAPVTASTTAPRATAAASAARPAYPVGERRGWFEFNRR